MRACSKLHKFLREDPKCFTRTRTTELLLPPNKLLQISDWQEATHQNLTLRDVMSGQIDWEDIQQTSQLTDGEKEMLQLFQADSLSFKEITEMYKISRNTFRRILNKVRKHPTEYD